MYKWAYPTTAPPDTDLNLCKTWQTRTHQYNLGGGCVGFTMLDWLIQFEKRWWGLIATEPWRTPRGKKKKTLANEQNKDRTSWYESRSSQSSPGSQYCFQIISLCWYNWGTAIMEKNTFENYIANRSAQPIRFMGVFCLLDLKYI